MARKPRIGSLAAELPVSLVEPDGLIVTTDGRYVRLIQCDRVPNTITANASELARIKDAFEGLCRIIPDGQSLVIYAQTDPVPIEDALASDERATTIAALQDRVDGHERLAEARERLFEATRQTVIAAAGAEQPAVSARWWVAVPYAPVSEDPRRQLVTWRPGREAGHCGRRIGRRRSRVPGSPNRSTARCGAPESRRGRLTAPRRSRCCGSGCIRQPTSCPTSRHWPARARLPTRLRSPRRARTATGSSRP